MDYRILVEPAAARRLRTFLPHVVQGLGRHLAELLEVFTWDGSGPAGSNGGARVFTIDVDGVTVSCRVDGRDETLTILDVQERPGTVAPAVETVSAAAPI
jgi:hypothetical protein